MTSFGERFGALIKRYREAQGLSSGELAEMALGDAAKRSRISELENGKVKRPHAKTIDLLVGYFNIPQTEVDTCRKPIADDYDRPRELLENLATRFGAENPDAPEAVLVAYLKQTAKDWNAIRTRLAELEAADGNLSNLLHSAEGLLEAGKFAAADDLLADAEEIQVTEKALKEARKSANIAQTRADAALLDGREGDAARHLTRAAGYLAGFDGDIAAGLRNAFAIRLSKRGIAFGGAGLNEAIKLYSLNLAHWQFETDPTNWAMTQNNLGAALGNQAKRVEGAAGADLLAGAVVAYEAALQVYTRDAAPQDWAMTQNNLGTALWDQAKRVEGAAGADLLALAVVAYEAALQVRTRDAAPQNWAATQNNLGLLFEFAATGSDKPKQELTKALGCFDAALEVYDRDHTPYYYNKCTTSRDQVLAALGKIN